MPWPRREPDQGSSDRTEIVDRTTFTGGDADGHAKAGVETGPPRPGAA
jgi:hypothetical protein